MPSQPDIVRVLEDTALEFEAAISGITEEQARHKPAPDRWSALECVEHVVAAENRMRSLYDSARPVDPQTPDPDRDQRLATAIRNRENKRESPEAAAPNGRFATLAEAKDAFRAARTASIALARDKGDALYSNTVKHIYFGIINGHDLLTLIAGHAVRHIPQIREAAGV